MSPAGAAPSESSEAPRITTVDLAKLLNGGDKSGPPSPTSMSSPKLGVGGSPRGSPRGNESLVPLSPSRAAPLAVGGLSEQLKEKEHVAVPIAARRLTLGEKPE